MPLPRGPVCFVGSRRLDAMDHLSRGLEIVAFADAPALLRTNVAALAIGVEPPRKVITLRGHTANHNLINKLVYTGLQYRVDFWIASREGMPLVSDQRRNFYMLVVAGHVENPGRLWERFSDQIELSREAFAAFLCPDMYAIFFAPHFGRSPVRLAYTDDDVRR